MWLRDSATDKKVFVYPAVPTSDPQFATVSALYPNHCRRAAAAAVQAAAPAVEGGCSRSSGGGSGSGGR